MPDDRTPEARTRSGRRSDQAVGDWSAAFAALPLETPQSDGWQRIADRLPAPRRTRWPAWLATAAVLALVAALPMKLIGPDGAAVPRPDGPAHPARTAPASDVSATLMSAVPPSRLATQSVGTAHDDDQVAATPESEASETPDSRPHGNDSASSTGSTEKAKTTRFGASGRIARHASRSDAPTRVGGGGRVAATTDAAATDSPNAPPAALSSELDRLYAESAQLEALLALARDDRVASGTAAALGDAFDARVAGIDADLAQSGNDATRRTALWRERVDAMRQLASFESTQRLLAARGERYDALLVSVD